MISKPPGPKVEINYAACTACGVCVEICPTDVFSSKADGKPDVAYPEDCEACFLCEFDCPFEAISVVVRKWFKTELA